MGGAESAWLGWVFAGAFGLAIGSFVNVVIHRVPLGESIMRPRSRCPACRTQIAARDNVPLLSYLFLRGRCRHCGVRISPRYPLIELACGLAFVAFFAAYGASLETLLWWAFAAVMIAAAGVDYDHGFIPDELSLGGLALGVLVLPAVRAVTGDPFGWALANSALGAALGAGALWTVGFAHARLSVALGRSFSHWPGEGEELPRPKSLDYWIWFPGLGFGDVKLIGMAGAFLGPAGVVQTILLASLLGLPLGLWLTRARGLATPFGFGPAIALAALAVAVVAPLGVWPL
jgi:leader peptidase (prepilin peptidase)/N-methyltransferase